MKKLGLISPSAVISVFFVFFSLTGVMESPAANDAMPLTGADSGDRPARPGRDLRDGSKEGLSGMGVKEIERSDGGRDKVYSSVSSPEEEEKNQREEKEKVDKSFEMLRNIVIEKRMK